VCILSGRFLLILISVDLGHSLRTGSDPLFFTDPVPWGPVFYNVGPLFKSDGYDPSAFGLEDTKVSSIFRDLQYYISLINGAIITKQRRRETEFQVVLGSVQYRLMQLQGTLDNLLSECLRLALLAFLTTTFQMPGRMIRYPDLANRFRDCCRAVEVGDTKPQMHDLMLWLLMVGAISVFETDDERWMHKRWCADAPDMSWPDARERLRKIMWMDAIHETVGEHAFEALNVREVR
jgi:hypothetical protein